MHCELMCGIWEWQSTIVEDLNDSQDPKHTLFCRENAFVAIYALFSDNNCPLFTHLGGGGFAERGQCHLFYRFYIRASLSTFICHFLPMSQLPRQESWEILFQQSLLIRDCVYTWKQRITLNRQLTAAQISMVLHLHSVLSHSSYHHHHHRYYYMMGRHLKNLNV